MSDMRTSDPRPLTNEPLPLDLVNTRWLEHGGVERDLLDEPSAARTWVQSHGHRGSLGAAELEALRDARSAIAAITASPTEPSAAARAALDAVLDHGHLVDRLGEGGVETRLVIDAPHHELAWRAAHGLIELLRLDPTRVRECAAHDCILAFHDDSPSGRRRWCSMQTCGNRAKARRHHARAQEA